MLGCRTPEYLQYYEILTFEFLAEKFISSTFAAVALNINPLWERRILIIFFYATPGPEMWRDVVFIDISENIYLS